MEEQIQKSDSYIAVEKMIRLREIRLSDLEHLLDTLQRKQRITTLEHEALLELAWTLSVNKNI